MRSRRTIAVPPGAVIYAAYVLKMFPLKGGYLLQPVPYGPDDHRALRSSSADSRDPLKTHRTPVAKGTQRAFR